MVNIVNKIDRKSLKPGDHIYAYRKLHCYSHHGIFVGGDRVIHFNITQGEDPPRLAETCGNCGIDKKHRRGVVMSCVDCFLRGHSLRRFQYGVGYGRYVTNWPGTCTTGLADPPEVTIKRAHDLLNDQFGDYNLPENNCEVFAVFCKTNKRVCNQAYTALLLLNATVRVAVDRLLHDVRVHHGEEKYRKLKKRIDGWLAKMSSLKQIIADLQKDEEDA